MVKEYPLAVKTIKDIPIRKYSDLQDKPTSLFLSLINDAAESRYEAALAQQSFDDVLFDIFANSDKVSSSTDVNVTTGTGGNIKLTKWTMIDDFEDGDIAEWTGDTGSFSAQTGTIINGSYTGELASSNAFVAVVLDITDYSNPFEYKIRIDNDTGNSSDNSILALRTGAGDEILELRFVDTGGFNEYRSSTTILSSWSINTTYTIKVVPDFGADTADIYVDGTKEASDVPFNVTASSFADVRVCNATNTSTGSRNIYVDDIKKKGSDYKTSGQFTSTTKSLGFTPTKVYLIQDVTLNGEDIEFELYDSGDTLITTITQSDIETEISIDTTDTSFYLVPKLSQSGGNTPELSEYGILFV